MVPITLLPLAVLHGGPGQSNRKAGLEAVGWQVLQRERGTRGQDPQLEAGPPPGPLGIHGHMLQTK